MEVRLGPDVEADVTSDNLAVTQSELTVSIGHQQEKTRKLLAFGMAAATVLVGVAYFLVPLWAGTQKWERAEPAFQVVFTALVGFTGSAITFYFTTRDQP
nr:hypothetical protein [Rhodococcus sp. 14C212]